MYVNIQEVVEIVQALKWQKDKDLGSDLELGREVV